MRMSQQDGNQKKRASQPHLVEGLCDELDARQAAGLLLKEAPRGADLCAVRGADEAAAGLDVQQARVFLAGLLRVEELVPELALVALDVLERGDELADEDGRAVLVEVEGLELDVALLLVVAQVARAHDHALPLRV